VTVSESSSSSSGAIASSGSSSVSNVSLSILDQIRGWTGDIHWSAIQQGTYNDDLVVSDAGYVPSGSLQGEFLSAPELGISRYRDILKQKLAPSGWQAYANFDAYGIKGTQWGYFQGSGADVRFLVVTEHSSDCTNEADTPVFVCARHESKVFLIDRVPQELIRLR
jgi:hypothetical protein